MTSRAKSGSSAGIGRTGTFIALSSLLLPTRPLSEAQAVTEFESPLGPLPLSLRRENVAATVDQLREWRGMLVQGPDQLRLIYEVAGGAIHTTS